jgi:hypothetical protein
MALLIFLNCLAHGCCCIMRSVEFVQAHSIPEFLCGFSGLNGPAEDMPFKKGGCTPYVTDYSGYWTSAGAVFE